MSETSRVQPMEELQKYLHDVITVETDIATQNQIIEQYQTICLNREPKLQLLSEPEKPKGPQYKDDTLPFWNNPLNILGIAMCPLFMLLAMVSNTGGNLAFFLTGLASLALLIPHYLHIKNLEKTNNAIYAEYEKKVSEYSAKCDVIEQKNISKRQYFEEQHILWKENKHKNEDALNQKLTDTQKVLAGLYTKDMIYEKYHTLPALTSIYEYLITGRCDGLTGPHGAYNLYEDEVRKDTVISQLNVVIENLEKIRANQYMLYQQVKTIQKNTSRISDELRTISSNTTNIMELAAINAYYSALTARNTEVTAAYHLLS